MLRQHLNSIGSICCQHALLLRSWPGGWCSCRTGQDNTEYITSNYDALTQCEYNAMPMSQTIGWHEIMLWVCWTRRLHYYTHTMCSSTLCRQTAVHMPTVSSLFIMLLTTGKTTHLACDGLMLGQRCGCWVSVHTTQGQCAVFVEKAGCRYILGRRGRFWERRIELLKRGVYSERGGFLEGRIIL